MHKQILAELARLEEEETFWNKAVDKAVDEAVDDSSEKALSYNLAQSRNATRAVCEFRENYKDELAYIVRYPFLEKV